MKVKPNVKKLKLDWKYSESFLIAASYSIVNLIQLDLTCLNLPAFMISKVETLKRIDI